MMRVLCSLILLIFFTPLLTHACTNFVVTKGASTSNHTMLTYSADAHVIYGALYHYPAAVYQKGDMLKVYDWDSGKYLGQIKQALQTYNVVGNINEYQVSIGETTFGGRKELRGQEGILDYGSLIYIALQRSKTAREAIKIMTDLVNEYGYASSGESFSIIDQNEVWIMELIGKGKDHKGAVWVARRIPDGYISGHANQARIRQFPLDDKQNCLYSKDVIKFAREKGWFNGKDKNFSFADAYDPIDFGSARFCEARVWSGFNKVNKNMNQYLDYAMGTNLNNRMPLYIKPDKKLSLQDVYGLMRNYYQNTPMDMTQDIGSGSYHNIVRWRPLTWEVDGEEYFHERAISTQQTGFVFVAECRSEIPSPLGGIIWFGVDDTYTTVFTPMYACMTKIPKGYEDSDIMTFNPNAAFWVFNQVSNFAYTRYDNMIKDIQPKQAYLEEQYINSISSTDTKARELYKQDPKEAINFLTNFSIKSGENTIKEWQNLYGFLFAKYMDGNIKTARPLKDGYKMMTPKVKQPGYDEEYYHQIIKNTGNKFKYPKTRE